MDKFAFNFLLSKKYSLYAHFTLNNKEDKTSDLIAYGYSDKDNGSCLKRLKEQKVIASFKRTNTFNDIKAKGEECLKTHKEELLNEWFNGNIPKDIDEEPSKSPINPRSILNRLWNSINKVVGVNHNRSC